MSDGPVVKGVKVLKGGGSYIFPSSPSHSPVPISLRLRSEEDGEIRRKVEASINL